MECGDPANLYWTVSLWILVTLRLDDWGLWFFSKHLDLRKIHHYTCAIHVQVFDRSHYGFPETFWPNNENCQIVSSVSWGWGWLQNIQKDFFQFLCIGMTINPPISKILLMVMKNQIINIQTRPLSPILHNTYIRTLTLIV